MPLALHWMAVGKDGRNFIKFGFMCILIHQIETEKAGRENSW